jgi:hypothetical protein
VITGTSFTGATAVKFGTTSATNFSVDSDTQITATVPTGASTGAISVTTAGGTGTSATMFTVIKAPTITSFTPTSGSVSTTVTITGTNYAGITAVTFNGLSAASYNVVSATSITAVVPVGATTGKIAVTNAAGTATSTGTFTVMNGIGNFAPLAGLAGDTVTITGQGFTGATSVKFNTTLATTFSVDSDNQITATVPAGTTTGKITVVTPQGTFTSAASYTIEKAPTISSFTPTSGKAGASVTITGSNFLGVTTVNFNGVSAIFTVSSATSIKATVPNGATTGKIMVINEAGQATSSASFNVTQ